MATICTRTAKGSALTTSELDANFTNLNTDKLETSGGTLSGALTVNGSFVNCGNTYPTTAASTGQVLCASGSGTLTFGSVSSGVTDLNGLSDVKADASNFVDSILITPGETATTGTLSSANCNIGIGRCVFQRLTSGYRNISFGCGSSQCMTVGYDNIASGIFSMAYHTGGSGNIALGTASLRGADGGSCNTGCYNIAIGYSAMESSTCGKFNVALGWNSGQTITHGCSDLMLGANQQPSSATSHCQLKIGTWNGSACLTWLCGTSAGNVCLPTLSSVLQAPIVCATTCFVGDGSALSNLPAGGATDMDGLSDVKASGTNFTNSLLIQPGATIATGILSAANGNVGIGVCTFRCLAAGTCNVVIGTCAGATLTNSHSNVFIGTCAGCNMTAGNGSGVSIGFSAGRRNILGCQVAVGAYALDTNENATGNVAVGYKALCVVNSPGNYNTAVGECALVSQTSAANNTAFGYKTGLTTTTGGANTYIGSLAGLFTTGSNNIGVGYCTIAGPSGSATANNNVAIGNLSGLSMTSANGNVIVGHCALEKATTASYNVAIGVCAGRCITTNSCNVLIGFETAYNGGNAMAECFMGNTIMGHQALHTACVACGAVAIGYRVAHNRSVDLQGSVAIGCGVWGCASTVKCLHNTVLIGSGVACEATNSHQDNTIVGSHAAFYLGGGYNVSLGTRTLRSATSASSNIAIGFEAGCTVTTGEHNLIIGTSLQVATTTSSTAAKNCQFVLGVGGACLMCASSKTACVCFPNGIDVASIRQNDSSLPIGATMLNQLTDVKYSGDNFVNSFLIQEAGVAPSVINIGSQTKENIGIGACTFKNICSGGCGNISIGHHGSAAITVGKRNTVLGQCALCCEQLGCSNVAIGQRTLQQQNGANGLNTAVGAESGYGVTTGSRNTFIGYYAGSNITTGCHNVIIGSNMEAISATGNGQLTIGTYQTGCWLTGDSSQHLTTYGNLVVGGVLSKSSGSFSIAHPLEAMKDSHQLRHSFIEGPKADNLYRGTATLSNGLICVNIDQASTMTNGTFVALNRCPVAYVQNVTGWSPVKGIVVDNWLNISSCDTSSNDTINWLVIAERCDPHMMSEENNLTDDNGSIKVEEVCQNLVN